MTPEELIDRHGGVDVHSSNTFEFDAERWESSHRRTDRRWGVGAYVEREGRVLLVRQDDQWVLPGGQLEPGETHAEGAVREVREEAGVEITIDGLLAVSEQTFLNAADGRSFEFSFATFRGIPENHDLSDDPGIEGEQIHEVAWLERVPENTLDRELVAQLHSRS